MKILNLGVGQNGTGVSRTIDEDDDDAVDPHLERIKRSAGDEDSDEEVRKSSTSLYIHIRHPVIHLII